MLSTKHQLNTIRSSAAQVLANVIQDLFPHAVLVGGGVTSIGFYYDFLTEQPIDAQMLEILDNHMRIKIKENKAVRSLSMMRENAHDFLIHHHQPFLAQQALQEDSNVISLFECDQFYSLSPEPHIQSTGEIRSSKLLEIEHVTRCLAEGEFIDVVRVIGTAFVDQQAFKAFIKAYEKLKKYDHRLLGPELQIFDFIEDVSQIDRYWLPKGKQMQEQFISLWQQKNQKRSVYQISSPLTVYEEFLHKQKQRFSPFIVEEEEYVLSGRRLKHHIQIFKKQWVNQQLPVRVGEIASVYEQIEESQVWGLFCSSSYQSDLVSIFCLEEQVSQELNYSLQMIEQIVRIFGFKAHWYLVVPGHKSGKGSQKKTAIDWLKQSLEYSHLSYIIEEKDGLDVDPRVEMRLVDSLEREWVGSYVEVATTARDQLKIEGQKPVIVAHTLFSSLDRWIGLLIEQWKGLLPFWLAPEQIRILTVGGQNQEYAENVYHALQQNNYRVNLDSRDEKLGSKVHAADKEKIPYLVIIGDKETSKKKVSIRISQDKDRTHLWDLEEFLKMLQEDRRKSLEENKTLARELKSQLES